VGIANDGSIWSWEEETFAAHVIPPHEVSGFVTFPLDRQCWGHPGRGATTRFFKDDERPPQLIATSLTTPLRRRIH